MTDRTIVLNALVSIHRWEETTPENPHKLFDRTDVQRYDSRIGVTGSFVFEPVSEDFDLDVEAQAFADKNELGKLGCSIMVPGSRDITYVKETFEEVCELLGAAVVAPKPPLGTKRRARWESKSPVGWDVGDIVGSLDHVGKWKIEELDWSPGHPSYAVLRRVDGPREEITTPLSRLMPEDMAAALHDDDGAADVFCAVRDLVEKKESREMRIVEGKLMQAQKSFLEADLKLWNVKALLRRVLDVGSVPYQLRTDIEYALQLPPTFDPKCLTGMEPVNGIYVCNDGTDVVVRFQDGSGEEIEVFRQAADFFGKEGTVSHYISANGMRHERDAYYREQKNKKETP